MTLIRQDFKRAWRGLGHVTAGDRQPRALLHQDLPVGSYRGVAEKELIFLGTKPYGLLT